jgi:AraC-like DNA-binding protein
MSEINNDLREMHMVGAQTREQIVSQHVCNALALYGIHLVGLSWALPEFRFVRPNAPMSQILVCLSGWGYVWVDGVWERCSEGMAYITPAGVPHGYYAVEETCWHICWVSYAQHERLGSSGLPILIGVDPRDLALAIERLYREAVGQGEQAVMHPWAQLVHVYTQRILRNTGGEERLQHLWDIVNEDIAYAWSSQELAERAGISAEHLRRLCQQYLNESPMKHVTQIRMRHAAVMLTSDAYSVEAVAHRVGYENAFAFSTAFKRYMGLSPSLYREEAKR